MAKKIRSPVGVCKNCGEPLYIELGQLSHGSRWGLYDNGYWCTKAQKTFAEKEEVAPLDNDTIEQEREEHRK